MSLFPFGILILKSYLCHFINIYLQCNLYLIFITLSLVFKYEKDDFHTENACLKSSKRNINTNIRLQQNVQGYSDQ